MSQDDLYKQEIEIGLEPATWKAIRAALSIEQAGKTERFARVIPAALSRIDAALAVHSSHKCSGGVHPNYDKGAPNLYVKASVQGWIVLSEIILAFGSQDAKMPGGSTIVAACSQAMYARQREDSNV